MQKNIKTIALLTGRGNNTLRDKNILKVLNKPCLAYPCIAAKKSRVIDDYFVSSDDINILNLAKKYGYKIIKRPKKISNKNTKHLDVLNHAIRKIQKEGINPDIVVVLLANSVTIKKNWIDECIKILKKNKKITSVVPVVKNNDHHPLRAKQVKNGFLKSYLKIKEGTSTNRQELDDNFFLCHNFWVIRTSEIIKNRGDLPWKFMGKNVAPYRVDNSIDIHEKADIQLSELWLKLNKTK